MFMRRIPFFFALLFLPFALVLAETAPSDAELIARFRAQKAEFNRLVEYLNKTNAKIFGPGYREYSSLKESLGVKRFYVTDRGPAAYRFPVYLRPPVMQYLRGYTKGYAWLPLSKNFPHYPGEIYMVDPEEPKTHWMFAPGDLGQFKVPRDGYNVALRHIEGPWYIYADNNPYRHSW
jgi:hypothetical protein